MHKNIDLDIDEELLAEAMVATGQPTKEATVEAALRKVVQMHQRWLEHLEKQKAAFEAMAGFGWEGDLDAMREGRER